VFILACCSFFVISQLGCVFFKKNVRVINERVCASRDDIPGNKIEQIIEQTYNYDMGIYGLAVSADGEFGARWGTYKSYNYIHIFQYYPKNPNGQRKELRFLRCEDSRPSITLRAIQRTNLWLALHWREEPHGDSDLATVFVFNNSGIIHQRKLPISYYTDPETRAVFDPENRTFIFRDLSKETFKYNAIDNSITPNTAVH
jgi:hypothetical protein